MGINAVYGERAILWSICRKIALNLLGCLFEGTHNYFRATVRVVGGGALGHFKFTFRFPPLKYLVEKKHVSPEEIIVISYTNKAIGELRERINQGLGIPAKICTFHAFDIVK